jgi:2-oxo-4-hydroxy-4-carboxy-5-ureidoimidazoline decarboxylase
MNAILSAWNAAESEDAIDALLSCCNARRWAEGLAGLRPFVDEDALFVAADKIWAKMEEPDWMEAFLAHPRIGEREAAHPSALSSRWSLQEQGAAEAAEARVLADLAEGNQRYEDLYGFTYIVRATGKSAEEMLAILKRRLSSDRDTELREAAEQQREITQIRLRKWLQV